VILAARVRESAAYLARRGVEGFAKALLLEPDMQGFAGELGGLTAVPMKEVPWFPPALSPSRNRKILFGILDKEPVVVMEGRPGLYEGCFHREISFPLRVLFALGVRTLLVASDMFSLHPDCRKGDLVLVSDHIDMTAGSTLRGYQPAAESVPSPPEGFYSSSLREKAASVAGSLEIPLREVVAALVNGPVGPTPAEGRMLRGFGAQAASMTLAAEAATAFQLGMSLVAVGIIRDGVDGAVDPSGWSSDKLAFFRQLLAEV
jgi:purine-nucleoside phosphorylase